jgi:hypothetical protein
MGTSYGEHSFVCTLKIWSICQGFAPTLGQTGAQNSIPKSQEIAFQGFNSQNFPGRACHTIPMPINMNKLSLVAMQPPEKYKENFDIDILLIYFFR